MMIRLVVPITIEERDALVQLAYAERRHPRAQAALILRQSLERAGYLQPQRPPLAANDERKETAQ